MRIGGRGLTKKGALHVAINKIFQRLACLINTNLFWLFWLSAPSTDVLIHYKYCPLRAPVERFIYVARGFVTLQISTYASIQSDTAKNISVSPPLGWTISLGFYWGLAGV